MDIRSRRAIEGRLQREFRLQHHCRSGDELSVDVPVSLHLVRGRWPRLLLEVSVIERRARRQGMAVMRLLDREVQMGERRHGRE